MHAYTHIITRTPKIKVHNIQPWPEAYAHLIWFRNDEWLRLYGVINVLKKDKWGGQKTIFLTMMTSSKCKKKSNIWKRTVSAITYWKLEDDRPKISEIRSNAYFQNWRHSYNSLSLNSDANMMTSQCPINHYEVKNRIYNSCAFRICNKNWGSPFNLRSYNWLKIGLILA